MQEIQLPYSEAAERNKKPILSALRETLTEPALVLEIGSGTGQHAVYFAHALAHLRWQPSELPDALELLRPRLRSQAPPNVLEPLALDVTIGEWPLASAGAVFSANTAHIMSWQSVLCMIAGASRIVPAGGHFCLYGPFNYDGKYTSESNAHFDAMLRARDPLSGLRDIADIRREAAARGLSHVQDYEMPANNRLQVWRKG